MGAVTVLLIDPDLDSIAIYSMILRHHGYEVIQAMDGESGLRLAAERRPDLVVSELFLPPFGTGEIVTRLLEDGGTADVPVILLDSTPAYARDRSGDRSNLRRLTKPCEPSRLLREVEQLLAASYPLAH